MSLGNITFLIYVFSEITVQIRFRFGIRIMFKGKQCNKGRGRERERERERERVKEGGRERGSHGVRDYQKGVGGQGTTSEAEKGQLH